MPIDEVRILLIEIGMIR